MKGREELKFLDSLNLEYKKIDYNNSIVIYKIDNKFNLVYCDSSSSTFKIDRELYDYLYNQKIEYSFFLTNRKDKKYFLLEYEKYSNWLRGSFESCKKNEIYFGKIVLNNQVTLEEFKTRMIKWFQK